MKPVRDENGNLDSYAWPGGYPLYYLTEDCGVLCPTCANGAESKKADESDAQWFVVGADVNWEDPAILCDNCNQRIESAYAEENA